jgi:pyruvate dehydrogenase E2 component (dihydrolipoamide acetyltransferase)
MIEFRMPSLGADMEAGTLVEWMVKPGDAVERGQVVAIVETQKGAIDVEIWDAGTVRELVVEPGAKVPVGAVLALLEGPQAAKGATAAAQAPSPAKGPPVALLPAVAAALPTSGPAGEARRRVSPAARKRAAELRVPIESVEPSAPGAAITVEDVETAARRARAAAGESVPAQPQTDWRASMRDAIAAAMSRSKREIPHYYLAADVDVTEALAWLGELNAGRTLEKRLLPAALFAKAVALALRRVPGLNGFFEGGRFLPSNAVHLGMAIAMRGGGLVAPAIHDADTKTLDETMQALSDLIERVRGGRLRSSELADPTVTLTSLGERGVDRVYGVIYPPQVAIVGLGRIVPRAWVRDGAVLVRKVVSATLAADHRASDGHLGARFLAELEALLGNPSRIEKDAA